MQPAGGPGSRVRYVHGRGAVQAKTAAQLPGQSRTSIAQVHLSSCQTAPRCASTMPGFSWDNDRLPHPSPHRMRAASPAATS